MPRRRVAETSRYDFRNMLAARFTQCLPPDEGERALLDWGSHYLPHYYVNEPSLMHEWIADETDRLFDRRGQKIALIGPRGGAKSTSGTLTCVTKRAVSGRETYVMLVSDTVSQAIEHLRSIKEELETNETLAIDYPEAVGVGPIWRENYIQMRNGCVIRAAGTLSRIRGYRKKQHRPSMIVLDDPENDEHTSSKVMRDRTANWFERTLMHMGDKRTNFLAMGTALHRDGLIMKLIRTPGWHVYREAERPSVFRAIVEWPNNLDTWAAWEKIYNNVDNPEAHGDAYKFFLRNQEEMEAGAVLLWPDREPLYELMCLRAEIGHNAFEAEKQGNPLNPEICEWPEEYFAGDDLWFDKWPAGQRHACRVTALDPSKGKNAKRGDYSAICNLVVDERGVYYFDLDLERRPTDKIISDAVENTRRFKPQIFGCEANQFQELLAEAFIEEAAARDVPVDVELIDNRVKKEVRIRRLSPLLAQRRIRFKRGSKGSVETLRQMRDFPHGDHDDGPDSMEMATRLAADLLSTPEADDGIGDTLEVDYGS